MRVCNRYSHRNGDLLLNNKDAQKELYAAIESCRLKFQRGAPAGIKEHILNELTSSQWVDKVKVGNSRLTINFLKDKIGVCFQIGNVARTYADILKLNHLGNTEIIDVGVIVVPHDLESRSLGTNYASFERLKNEIQLFKNEINTPLVVIGISN